MPVLFPDPRHAPRKFCLFRLCSDKDIAAIFLERVCIRRVAVYPGVRRTTIVGEAYTMSQVLELKKHAKQLQSSGASEKVCCTSVLHLRFTDFTSVGTDDCATNTEERLPSK